MNKFKINNQAGFTITELMIGLFLSAIILAGVLSVYSSNKSSFRSQETLNRIQESYRFGSSVLQKDVRLAGYYGCNQESPIINNLSSLPFIANYERPIEGFNAASNTAWDRLIATTGLSLGTADGDVVRGGTDILVIRRAGVTEFPIDRANTTLSENIKIQGTILLNDVLLISDCLKSTIFQATAWDASTSEISYSDTGGNIGNTDPDILPVGPPFDLDANVMVFQTIIYFVGTDSNGMPALKRKINSAASETIMTGVENMQVVYGVDSSADRAANRYVNAANVLSSEWKDITSARISLLMASHNSHLPSPDIEEYVLLDETIKHTGSTITHAGDKKFRQVVSMTVDVRNPMNNI